MNPLFTILFLSTIIFTSCTDEIKANLNKYNDAQIKYYTLYRSENINDAEDGIRGIIVLTEDYKKNNLINGYNYDESLAFDYTRLYLIQKEKGSLDDADKSLDIALEHFLIGKKFDPKQTSIYKDIIIKLVNELDDNAEIKPMWKSEGVNNR